MINTRRKPKEILAKLTPRSTTIVLSVMIAVFLFTSELQAIVGTPDPDPPLPQATLPDLPAGTQYQIIFMTSGTTDAMNPNLSHCTGSA